MIELLVREGGCNVDVVDHMQLRPINKALYYDRDPSIVQALIRCGAQVGSYSEWVLLLVYLVGMPFLWKRCWKVIPHDFSRPTRESSCTNLSRYWNRRLALAPALMECALRRLCL